jgi:hypothetical protein
MENMEMTSTKQTSAAEQTRDAYRKERLERARQDPPPTMTAPDVPEALGPIPGDNRYLWPKVKWGDDVKMIAPQPATIPYAPNDILEFRINRIAFATRTLVDPVGNPAELEYLVPGGNLENEGDYEFSYFYERFLDQNRATSHSRFITVDHGIPNGNNPGLAPGLPAEIVQDGGLWKDYLDTHPTVDITVPRSSDILPGDRVDIYVGNIQNPGGGLPIFGRTLTLADNDFVNNDPVVLSIPSDRLVNLAPDLYAVLYRYTDRAGNQGQLSVFTQLDVDLRPRPGSLQTPQVPLHADGLIDRQDGQVPVTVLIPAPGYTNQEPGDDIEVIWEGRAVPAMPVTTFPREIIIDWPMLKTGDTPEIRTFNVSYNIVRGKGRTPSSTIPINVDFTLAGVKPPDPDNPDPTNPLLPKVVVKSRDPNPVDNVLTDADKNLDATAEVECPADMVTGDFLRLYWGTLDPWVAFVQIDQEQAGEIIPFTVPWDKIEEGGYNDKLPVHYRTWNGVNEQRSPVTDVDVRITDIVGLADVVFPDRHTRPGEPERVPPLINCCSEPWNGLRVQVPGDPINFAVGDTITLSWQGYESLEGVDPIPSTTYAANPVPLDTDKVENGFELTIPYTPYVEDIITLGSGLVTYVLKKGNAQEGTNVTLVSVSRLNGDGRCSAEFPGVCP